MLFYKKWKDFLNEAPKDAKILRNINIDFIKKEMPQFPEEETRDYYSRIQALERDPEYLNPVFPQELVDWMDSLPDNHFPTSGRKRFAKWLGNTIYYEETDGPRAPATHDAFSDISRYNNDVRYIVDFINGADERYMASYGDLFWTMNWWSMLPILLGYPGRSTAYFGRRARFQ